MTEKIESWVILVPQIVKGKSRPPSKNKPNNRWIRSKPYPYRSASNPHEILYGKKIHATRTSAIERAKEEAASMSEVFIFGMTNPSNSTVSGYRVVLLNRNTDEIISIAGSYDSGEKLWANRPTSKPSARWLRTLDIAYRTQ